MKKRLNKNKKTKQFFSLLVVIVITSFLFYPNVLVIAQASNTNSVNTNTDTNTNTNNAVNQETNTNTNTNNQSNTNVEEEKSLIDLNKQIEEKRKLFEELDKKTKTYEENIKIKQQETLNLQNELAVLDIQIANTNNEIEKVKTEIEEINLEIEKLKKQIEEKEQQLSREKEKLAEFIRILNYYDQKTYLEIFIVNKSLSEFFDQMKQAQDIEKSIKGTVDEVKGLKKDLENKKTEREIKRKELEDLQEKLNNNVFNQEAQKDYKTDLLAVTKLNEAKFEELLDQAKQEQQQANSEISTLEEKAREKLNKEGINLNEQITQLSWPVPTDKGISAYFHDPTYIFRKYFEHPAVDIAVSQGTEVKAAANGYVARAKNAGMGYSYVMIIHNNTLSTVYGHLSRIDVTEDTYVVKGQTIGLSGGIPGTPGAGRMTTGAHLHFEVRVDGIPVNPLDYLPSI